MVFSRCSRRTATMRTLQEYTRLKSRADRPADLSWRLVLDAMLCQGEAELRWLDHCEASTVRYTPPASTVTAQVAAADWHWPPCAAGSGTSSRT